MKYYHSFPRPRHNFLLSEAEACEYGTLILESMHQCGLLLTEEEIRIPPNPNSELKNAPETSVNQYRSCFSFLSHAEICCAGHSDRPFGRFSIGLDTAQARKLGIVPTFYYYKGQPSDRAMASGRFGEEGAGRMAIDDNGFSEEILYRLAELRRLAISVAHIERKAEPENPKYKSLDYLRKFELTLDDESERMQVALSNVTAEQAKSILPAIKTDRVPAYNLAEWVEMILSIFQTSDSSERGRHLAYYSQREWRIVQSFNREVVCLPIDLLAWPELSGLKQEVKQCLVQALENVRRLQAKYGMRSGMEKSFLLTRANGVHFWEFVKEIVVPRGALDLVKSTSLGPELQQNFLRKDVGENRGSQLAVFERRAK